MQLTSALVALTTVIALAATPVFAVDAVVKVMSDVSCNAETARWRPDCSGSCHRFNTDNFNSLKTNGNGVFGVNCQVFSDDNCVDYIGQTGNHVSTSQQCYPFASGKSVICYYRC